MYCGLSWKLGHDSEQKRQDPYGRGLTGVVGPTDVTQVSPEGTQAPLVVRFDLI